MRQDKRPGIRAISIHKNSFFRQLLFPTVVFYLSISFLTSYAHADSFLCLPWKNSNTRSKIGESFLLEINHGVISFRGENKPISFAQFIYSHPLHDIFLAGSGEIVTAGLKGQQVHLNVFFAQSDVRFFVMTTCKRV